MDAQVMAGVAGAVAAAVDVADDGSDDEMSDSAPFVLPRLLRTDEHGSDLEDDPEEDMDYVPPPPPADCGSAQKSVDDRVRDLWFKWMGDHKIKNARSLSWRRECVACIMSLQWIICSLASAFSNSCSKCTRMQSGLPELDVVSQRSWKL